MESESVFCFKIVPRFLLLKFQERKVLKNVKVVLYESVRRVSFQDELCLCPRLSGLRAPPGKSHSWSRHSAGRLSPSPRGSPSHREGLPPVFSERLMKLSSQRFRSESL